jgi:hypothetical protein
LRIHTILQRNRKCLELTHRHAAEGVGILRNMDGMRVTDRAGNCHNDDDQRAGAATFTGSFTMVPPED